MSDVKEGTDLDNVLISEADQMPVELPDSDETDELVDVLDPMQIMLRCTEEQTRLLNRIHIAIVVHLFIPLLAIFGTGIFIAILLYRAMFWI